MERIFISYSREDHAAAKDIYDTLLNRPDIEPWLDQRRLKLVPYDAEIKQLIEQSSYILALISDRVARSGEICVVEHVESFPTELKLLVFGPGHGEVFVNSHIEVCERRAVDGIACAGVPAEREAESSQRRILISKELNRASGGVSVNALADRTAVPVENRRCVLGKVDRESAGVGGEWEAGAIPENSRGGPTAENRADDAIGIAQKMLSAPKRQIVNVVCADDMASVEQRISPARSQVGEVANQTLAVEGELVGVVRDVGLVVYGMGIGIVEIELKIIRVALTEAPQQRVVGREE